MKRPLTIAALTLACFLPMLPPARAAAPAPAVEAAAQPLKFIRFSEDNEGGGKLETAIVTFRNPAGARVHLVAAVHVGERGYYQDLNKTFAGYDALLYELVKPKGMRIPREGIRAQSGVAVIQRILKDVLELSFQLDEVDYSAANFVHADLDAETFARLQEERGESMFTLMLRMMLNEMTRPQPNMPEMSLPELLVALTAPDRARHFKLLLGRQFEDIEAKVAGFEGPNGSVLVTERDKAAIRVLRETLASGKKNIGIFYGAAHMPDLTSRLRELGFTHERTEWRTAWDMTPKEGDVVVRVVRKKPTTQPQP